MNSETTSQTPRALDVQPWKISSADTASPNRIVSRVVRLGGVFDVFHDWRSLFFIGCKNNLNTELSDTAHVSVSGIALPVESIHPP
jgi:hypothetical protein